MRNQVRRIHFVGIGGTGMCGMAEVLLNDGYLVSGSDLRETEVTRRLKKLKGAIYIGHDASQVHGADVVVVSSAVPEENIEVAEARRLRIPVIPRQEMLAELMRMRQSVAVTGSHGKTTTTSMIGHLLHHAGMDPTVVLGGRLSTLGSHARLGQGEVLVAEADESDRTFLKLLPTIVLITNMDQEHLDTYRDLDDIKEAFLLFANKVPFYGSVFVCLDDENLQALIPGIARRLVTFGMSSQAEVCASDVQFEDFTSSFEVTASGKHFGSFELGVPGRHNVLNALGAVAVARELSVSVSKIAESLLNFPGADRRFEKKGCARGVTVFDDYAHHPTEIRETLRAAREGWSERIIAVFQPHRYTRVNHLFDVFTRSFYNADVVIVMGIYPAGETPINGVSSERLFESIRAHGHRHVIHAPDRAEAVKVLTGLVDKGDMVITLGAGDVWKVGTDLLRELGGRDG